ncbi:MAG: hypothetical protein WBB08_00390 [Halobacteriota archaeon]
MPSRSNLEKRMQELEKALTPEEIAQIVTSVIDRAFDKEITTDEAYWQLEELKKRYLDPMDYDARVKFGELGHCRWGYTYFKTVVECIDFKIAYIQMLLLLRESHKSHEDCIRALQDSIPEFKPLWEKHCEEHPEAKYYEESHKELPQRLMEIDIGKLLDGLAELDRQKEEILNDEKLNAIWDEMGYEPLSSVLETEGLRNANKNHREKD